ncbi:nucleotidyltransferase domain-containing protein [Actinomadura geliboluensis]|uniref:nucleotidyltransferase domain-containing protein n=1 Tax=Actinomadura geliboluensis TaxID=882440 RepID=UPI003678E484
MAEPANVLLSGIVGSTAYGLAGPGSDIDRLGLYAAPTIAFHGLHPPTGRAATTVTTKPDVTFHEAAKFAALCLGMNPTVTELLWLPDELYETRTALGDQLISIRTAFLSARRVRDAYLGYATQQFHRLEARGDGSFSADTRKRTAKHARHLARLVHQGLQLYSTGHLDVRLPNPQWYLDFGERVAAGDLAVARRVMADAEKGFATVSDWNASAITPLPDEPDQARVEEWLHSVRAAHLPAGDGPCPHAAEAARLHEGEDASPLDPAVEPTPAQWLHRFNNATPQQRLAWAEDILRHARDSSRCRFELNHDEEIEELRANVRYLHRQVLDLEQPVRDAALAALAAMRAGDHAATDRVLNQLCGTHGTAGITTALMHWCDAALAHMPAQDGPVGLSWVDTVTGRVEDTDAGVPITEQWACRLLTARANDDRAMFTDLIQAVPAEAIPAHVGAMVQMAACIIQEATP